MKRNIVISALVAVLFTFGTLVTYQQLTRQEGNVKVEYSDSQPVNRVLYTKGTDGSYSPLDFTEVAAKVMDAVVHIQSTGSSQIAGRGENPFGDFFNDDLFERFFGPQRERQPNERPSIGAGSGVIFNSSGYIVTNNHVVANAQDIEVTLHDNRSFKASLIGTDPSTDLAVIRIDQGDLPTLSFSTSADVKVGEWVLAVGNPFNLNSTVTAGIVSAKSRNINILNDQYAVESFIQTDAAINPGNSGGALVNLNGNLIGINTAIASPTGSYSGYGFAVPSDIVSKVVEDIVNFGVVQRGYLGIMVRSVTPELVRERQLKLNDGAFVDSVLIDGAAEQAGLRPGDVITEVNGTAIKSNPELLGYIARFRPGDELFVVVDRKGGRREFTVTLKNREGNTGIVAKPEETILQVLGIEIEDVNAQTALRLAIPGGVKVTEINQGKVRSGTDMRPGFIITKVDNIPVTTSAQLLEILESRSGGILLEGIYENYPGKRYYALGL